MKHIISLALLLMGLSAPAQTIMNIYQNNGTVLQIPLSSIDSITYTVNNPGNLATLTTLPMGNITATSAVSGGNITGGGGTPVTQRGVCWNTAPNPTPAHQSITPAMATQLQHLQDLQATALEQMENPFDPPLLPDAILQNLANISRQAEHTLHNMTDLAQSMTPTDMDADFPPLPSQPNPDATSSTPNNNQPKRKKPRSSTAPKPDPTLNLKDA